jgi:hypothetical protein
MTGVFALAVVMTKAAWSAERRDVPIARDVKTPRKRLGVPRKHAGVFRKHPRLSALRPPRSPKVQKKEGQGIEPLRRARASLNTRPAELCNRWTEDRAQMSDEKGPSRRQTFCRPTLSSDLCYPLSSVLCPLSSDRQKPRYPPFRARLSRLDFALARHRSSVEKRRREEKCRVIIGLS